MIKSQSEKSRMGYRESYKEINKQIDSKSYKCQIGLQPLKFKII
jgi:hypothetical protein